MSISIFAKQAFLNTDPHQPFKEENYHGRGHLMRVSSVIRGNQIAEAIGARLNPEKRYKDDVCIYVKPHLKKDNMTFEFKGKKSYIDIIDGHNLGQAAKNYPDVGVIVCSQVDYKIMSRELFNEIVLIPQHHCNFERLRRQRLDVNTVGVIGVEKAFDYLPKDLEKELEKRDMKLVKFSKFFDRQDIIDFYMNIDIQIVWRPYKKVLSNPLKIVNAASFGVPTIALDELAFKEVENCYIPVKDLREFFAIVKGLQKGTLYSVYSQECFKQAEEYHIDNIAKKYKELDI